jgi:hypothetical protein
MAALFRAASPVGNLDETQDKSLNDLDRAWKIRLILI